MSNDSSKVRTDLVTNGIDPLAAARDNTSPMTRAAQGRAKFAELLGVGGGDYDSLPEGGKQAFAALTTVDKDDERYPGALRAALDAVRDAERVGLFNPQAPASPTHIAESTDPAVRNQSPTGTAGESSGSPPVAPPVVTSSGTSTPSTIPAAPPPPATSDLPTEPATPAAKAAAAVATKGEPNTTTPAVKGSPKG